jgi:tryptophanyl-tRNA synthetase
LGADLDVDVPYQYLTFFMDDDKQLEDIKQKYSKGELLTGEVKAILIDVINKFLKDFQEKRAKVTDEDVRKFMEIRQMNPYPKAWKEMMEKKAAQEAEKKKAKEKAKGKAALDDAERLAKKKAEKEAKKKAAVEFAKKKEAEAKAKK